jgi:diguanylate cyclase (GGDEF)-like protein
VTQRKSVTLQAVEHVAQYVRVTRFDSIKSRILALAVLGTIVPAGITLGVAYIQNRRALEAKITQDLVSESSQSARAVSVWAKEQLYDLRVYATSEEVLTNIGSFSSLGFASPRLLEYLRSLQQRATGFEQLAVLDANGRVVASSVQQREAIRLPAEWQRTLRQQEQLVGDAYWDPKSNRGKLILAVPVRRPDGRMLGAFAAEINLAPLQSLLRMYLTDSTAGAIYLVSDSGRVLASSREISEALLKKQMPTGRLDAMARRDTAATTFRSVSGVEVLGTLRRVPRMPWSVVSEVSAAAALAQVQQFRNFGLTIVAVLLLVVAGTAYRLGLIIVRPLERLTRGAAEVANGDFDADLPTEVSVSDAGEVGALTSVFKDMVTRLRKGRQELASANQSLRTKNEELERLSVTDGLTGLVNHRALMQRLHEEGVRSKRNNRPFSVIMTDVDHFKQYNDEFGHPQGDVVLKQVAGLLKDSTRTVDCVARYGGEEFAVLLPETEMSGALEVAERIRSRVERAEFPNRKVTLSIGVAEFPRDAETTKEIIVVADAALYVAKHNGRNQVAQAGVAPAGPQRLPRVSGKRKAVPAKKKG